ncbi:MAG: hypothetical protein IJ912_11900 [Fibrobacter sp.]|nr:hypothetical protein [Fibrobacter sp.]
MIRIQMRNAFAFYLGSLALLAGCAGFTEDVNGDVADDNPVDVRQIESQYALARVAQSGKVERSSAGDSITIVFEMNGGCVKEGESFAYDQNFYFADSLTFAYSFRGDTLLLSRTYEPDPYEVDQERYEESFIWVGGTSGKLDGIWKNTQCRYREEKMGCMSDGYDQFLKFYGDKVEYRFADREDYDYMQTVFVDQLFDFLGNGGSIQLETPYYYSDTKFGQESSGISILEKTNTTVKFTHADLTFELSVDYAHYKDSLHVTLKSGDVSCVGTVRDMDDVLPGMCSDDNADYLWKSSSGAYTYERMNSSEFETCIDGILGRKREL